MKIHRRALLSAIPAALICAPAIVRASSLMPVKVFDPIHDVWIRVVGVSHDGLGSTLLIPQGSRDPHMIGDVFSTVSGFIVTTNPCEDGYRSATWTAPALFCKPSPLLNSTIDAYVRYVR